MVSGETGAAVLGRQPRTRILVLALALAAGVAVLVWPGPGADPQPAPEQVTRPEPPYRDVEWFEVTSADDNEKAGVNRSVMVQHMLTIDPHTCGVSGDQLRVRFDQPVEVTGVDISVDIGGPLELVEVMASANGEAGYDRDADRTGDPLAHTSWAPVNGAPRAIDKTTILPAPISVPAGGFVTIGAWLCGGTGQPRVSPEVILHYRWIGYQSPGSLQ